MADTRTPWLDQLEACMARGAIWRPHHGRSECDCDICVYRVTPPTSDGPRWTPIPITEEGA